MLPEDLDLLIQHLDLAGGDIVKLDKNTFFTAIVEGREIEICFRGKWYFFRENKSKKKTEYLCSEIHVDQFNEILVVDSVQKLMNMRIQDFPLIDVLSDLDDCIVF